MRTSSILWVEYPLWHAGNPDREADPERVAATGCDRLGVRRVRGLGDTAVFGALVPAVGGRAAGFTGLVASVLLLDWVFLPPVRGWSVGDFTTAGTGRVSSWVVLAVFLVVGAVAVEVIARERDARRRAGAAESR